MRTRPQHNAGPGVSTGKATLLTGAAGIGTRLGSLSFN